MLPLPPLVLTPLPSPPRRTADDHDDDGAVRSRPHRARRQRRGSTRELIDKEEGIKKAYPEQAARKTGQRIKQAIKRESGE